VIPDTGSLGSTILGRLDEWNKRSHWMPEPDDWFPSKAFWGIFVWNFPFLLVAIGGIGALMYRSDPDPSGIGFFTPMSWVTELAIGTLGLTTLIDFAGCLWLRRLWNKRARWIRKSTAA